MRGVLAIVDIGSTGGRELTVVPIAASISGKKRVKTVAQNRHVATAQPIPTSRCDKGKTSAEYANGTGPSPGE